MNKRLTLSLAALLLLGLALPRTAAQVPTNPFCTDRLIRGTYGFTIEDQA